MTAEQIIKEIEALQSVSANVSSNACARLGPAKSHRTSSMLLRISKRDVSFPWKQRLMKNPRARELSISRCREILAGFLPAHFIAKSIGPASMADLQEQRLRSLAQNSRNHELSTKAKHTIYGAVIERDLRVIFRVDGSWVTTLDVGTHKLYRARSGDWAKI